MNEFKPQNLANMAWACATVNRLDEKLFAALARSSEWRLIEFNVQDFLITLWAFSLCEGLNDAWSLFDHTNHLASHPKCFGVLCLECEQSG